jgi:hypothetical protein
MPSKNKNPASVGTEVGEVRASVELSDRNHTAKSQPSQGSFAETRRQDDYDRARHLAQMKGGEIEDWLDDKYKNGNSKWTYAKGEFRGGNVIAEYMYQDEHREPYLKVERTDTKQFPQSHWDGKRWRWGKPKGSKIPYYLPDLIEATPETPIYICEGEKDADTLTNIQLLATCASEVPSHKYIFIPTREMWPATSVNSRVPPVPLLDRNGEPVLDKDEKQKFIPANAWLDQNKPVEQMTWAPGEPMEIKDRLVSEGGWFERKGATCFNLYRPPTLVHGDPKDVAPWLDHINKVYPNDAAHIVNYCAHRVQHPEVKINHALFLGGEQGIGKDTILEPVKRAIGPWNFMEVTPQNMTGQFNGYLKSVILRVSEARDLGEVNRYSFYEHMKTYTASPPDVHRVNEKNLKEHYILNCNGTIITSNHKTDGIYLPADDRRNYIAWSDCKKEDFDEAYWNRLWGWYENGGDKNVAAYLATLDISTFNPKAPPPKTEAFWAIVHSNVAPEESQLADLLDNLGNPKAITLSQLLNVFDFDEIGRWLNDHKNIRAVPHKLESCGYTQIRNKTRKDGRWIINNRRQVVYAKRYLSFAEQHAAAAALVSARTTATPTRRG